MIGYLTNPEGLYGTFSAARSGRICCRCGGQVNKLLYQPAHSGLTEKLTNEGPYPVNRMDDSQVFVNSAVRNRVQCHPPHQAWHWKWR
jgi:hypothetical protein